MSDYNIHPKAPDDVKEKVVKKPCLVCGYRPIDEYSGPTMTNQCPGCKQQRPYYETWTR